MNNPCYLREIIKKNQTAMNNDENALSVAGDSLSEYTPYKLHRLLATAISSPMTVVEEPRPVETENMVNSSFERAKTPSRKRSFIRHFFPLNRSRSSLSHHERDSSYQTPSINTYDMRFFIIRHGERVDRYFGSNWYKLAFDQNNQYRPYHQNFPSSLPLRSNNYYWALDTPLTSVGLYSAEKLGRTLKSKNSQPHFVYSSPTMRCILTTIQILKGLNLKHPMSIRIEPGLLEFGAARFGMHIFLQPLDWHKYGINIDLSYQPIITNIPLLEREDAYYLRSKYVIREMENRHQNSTKDLANIFIVAHATSSDTLTWDLIGKKPNANDLYQLSLNITYLQTVIAERQKENKVWSVKPIR